MAYLGKTYTLENQEKFVEFFEAMGVPKDRIDAITSVKSIFKVTKDGDTYTVTGTNTNVTFKSGEEFDDNRVKAKSVYVVDGNTITNTMTYPDKVLTFKHVFDGDKLVVTATSNKWDGTAYRYFSA